MRQFESSPSMAPIDKNESAQQYFVKIKPHKGYIKINDNINTQVAAIILGVVTLSGYFTNELTPLFEPLHSIMSRLINSNVLKLHPIRPINNSKPLPPYHDHKSFCQYHHQTSHETEKWYTSRS